jgi:hypothetical protein
LYQRGRSEQNQQELQDRREREARQERRALHNEDAYSRSLQNLMQTRQQTDQSNLEREKLGLQWHPKTKAAQEQDAAAMADIQQQVATGKITQSQGRDGIEQLQTRYSLRQPTERPSEPFKAREESLPSGLVNVYGDPMNPNRITHNYVPTDKTTAINNQIAEAHRQVGTWTDRAEKASSEQDRKQAKDQAASFQKQADALSATLPGQPPALPPAQIAPAYLDENAADPMLRNPDAALPLPQQPLAKEAEPRPTFRTVEDGQRLVRKYFDGRDDVDVGANQNYTSNVIKRSEAARLVDGIVDSLNKEVLSLPQQIATATDSGRDATKLKERLDLLQTPGQIEKIADDRAFNAYDAHDRMEQRRALSQQQVPPPQFGGGGQQLQPGWFARQGATEGVPPSAGQAVLPAGSGQIQGEVGNAPALPPAPPRAPQPTPDSIKAIQASAVPQKIDAMAFRSLQAGDQATANALQIYKTLVTEHGGIPPEDSEDAALFAKVQAYLVQNKIDFSGKKKPREPLPDTSRFESRAPSVGLRNLSY